ncbi:MAG: hypothetical protein U1E65_34025 [Myxococcota bacterium]
MPAGSGVRRAVLFLCTVGCASAPHHRDNNNPALPRPIEGSFTILRGDEEIGSERFTITSSAGVFSLSGALSLGGALSSSQSYALEVDARTFEPRRFRVALALADEVERVEGTRAGDSFQVSIDNIAGHAERRIPYAKGTMIDLGTPLSHAVALSLLLPTLEERRPVSVRTIRAPLPLLIPEVVVLEYTLYGRSPESAEHKVAVKESTSRGKPSGLWLGDDGLVVRARIFGEDGGPPFDFVLDAPEP